MSIGTNKNKPTSEADGSGASRTANLLPVALLGVALAAYTLQTELASYVQHTLDYKKPYFLFFCTHSGYMLLWPCHLLALKVVGTPVGQSLRALIPLLAQHFAPSPSRNPEHHALPTIAPSPDFPFPYTTSHRLGVSWSAPWARNFVHKVALLTIFIAAPSLSWYAAVPLTSMADLTAIYNVFAFWAYLLSLKFLPSESAQTKFQARLKLCSVLLAVGGVFVIAYGDLIWGNKTEQGPKGSNRVLGNGLALFGSLAYAGYEVWYKIKIALPEPSQSVSSPTGSRLSETSSLLSTRSSSPIPDAEPSSTSFDFPPPPSPSVTLTDSSTHSSTTLNSVTPSPTLFLLYSNLVTSMIGLFTFLFLWIPIPFLDYLGWEVWEGFPPRQAWGALAGIIGGSILFNASFMILLSLWGPVVASVANLLTLILVAVSDALFVPTAPPLTRSSLAGGGLIVAAFAGLIWGEYGVSKGDSTSSKETRSGRLGLQDEEDEAQDGEYENRYEDERS